MPNEEFKHYQPLGNSDPAHTASAPGALTDSVPAMTPLMLDSAAGKLVVWDGAAAGTAKGILAIDADQNSDQLTFFKTGSYRVRQ